jgi:cytochrome o ubiquinol oxidase subunit 2
MKKKYKIGLGVVLAVFLAVAGWYISRRSIPILQPAGTMGRKELHLIILACVLAAVVVLPTYAIAIMIAVKYREENHDKPGKRVKYNPDFDHSRLFESIWWGIPIVIIGFLSVVAWNSSHELDPYKALVSDKKPLTIQVVALDWKWLFIYPDQGVASVNLAEIPVGVPVDFHVTSDTIMNSFWVPALGGQIYAMPGMDTQLHEQADKAGSFMGSPANIAGSGFSRMDFTVRAAPQATFDAWVKQAQQAPRQLTAQTYRALAKPSDNVPVTYYAGASSSLYNDIVMKYMMPQPEAVK